MNNEYIISYLSKHFIHGVKLSNIGIHADMDEYIQKNYRWGCDDGDWYKVHCVDRDSKYGAYMVEPHLQQFRSCDLEEFYGIR